MADRRSGKFAGKLLVAAIAAFGIALVSGLPPESGRAQAQTGDTKSCDRIVGVWTWIVNGDVAFSADGTLVQGKITGRWFCNNRGEIAIIWSHGFTDIVTISADGTRVAGTSNVGGKVSGVRKATAVNPTNDPLEEFFKEFFDRRKFQSSPPPSQAGPKPAPTPSTQAGEWTTGWSRMEVTATLRALGDDAKRGLLGIRIGSVDAFVSLLVPNLKHGVFVVAINNESAVTGLMQQGDIVTTFDGRAVRSPTHLTSLVGRNPPGTLVKIEFWRRGGGYPELLSAISRSAQANDPAATHVLGVLETLSIVGKPDYAKAFNYYLRAANLGSAHGMVAAAGAYRSGSGADKSPSEAARWYRQAIELGSASAMYGLATLIVSGQIGDVDRVDVFRLMERAAKAGHVMANYAIASYYNAGYGTAQNPEAGARHLIEAIRHGGTEMLVQFSTEKTWQPSAEFFMALQRQLQERKLYQGAIDGTRNAQMLAALVRLLVESAP